MKYIAFNDNLELSKIVVGCMRIGEKGESLLSFVEKCIDLGINSFDHAPVYGGYKCEKIFGDRVIKKSPRIREKIKIISKTGITLPKMDKDVIYYDSRGKSIIKEVEKSLKNFGTDYLDLLLVHRPDPISHIEDTASALDKLVDSGKVLNIGVSNFTPPQVATLGSALSVPIITNQVELSVKSTANIFNGVTDDAILRKMPLMAWSPLGGGSIFHGKDQQSIRLNQTLSEIASKYESTLDSIAYAWIFKIPAKTAVITGSTEISRIENAVRAIDIDLKHEEWYRILAASRGYNVP